MDKNFLAFRQAIFWLLAIYCISQFMNEDLRNLERILNSLCAGISGYWYHRLLMQGKNEKQ